MHKVANIFSTFLVVRIVDQFQKQFISISDLDEIKNVYAFGFNVGLVELFEVDGFSPRTRLQLMMCSWVSMLTSQSLQMRDFDED